MDEALALLTDLAERLIADVEDLAAVRLLGLSAQIGGSEGIAALLKLARLVGEAAEPDALAAAIAAAQPSGALAELALAVAGCFAAVRATYPSRQDATAARARIAATADLLYPRLAAAGPDAVNFLVRLAGQTVLSLSAIAASRAALVRVETNISLPSSLLAYDLYGDPGRAAELVGRNHVATPLVMPAIIEAVAV